MYSYDNLIKIENGVPSRTPVPDFMWGLDPISLYDLTWTDPSYGVEFAVWWPVENVNQELPYNSKFGEEVLTIIEDRKVVQVSRQILPMTEEEILDRDEALKTLWREQIIERRKIEVVGGTIYDGHPLPTDASSRVNLSDLRGEALVDSTYSANFKFDDSNWMVLDATKIFELATLVRNYVQDCYDREYELLVSVDDFTFTSEMLNTGWPNANASSQLT